MRRMNRKTDELAAALDVIRQARLELETSNDPEAPLPDQLLHWHKVREFYDTVKAIANEAEHFSRHMSFEQLPKAFQAFPAAVRTVKLDGIGRFTLSSRTTAKVLNWPEANNWLDDCGHGDAVREMVPASTMNSLVSTLLKDGIEPEPTIIDVKTYPYTSFTKE